MSWLPWEIGDFMDILTLIKNKAKEKKNKILLIEGEDNRIIKAASMAVKDKICQPVLLGDEELIKKIAAKDGVDLNGIEILEYKGHPKLNEFAQQLYKLRKHKGLTLEKAKELLQNPNYFGALMLKLGLYDGAVGGCKYSTAEWMRPVFQVIGTKKGVTTVSAICIAHIKDKVYFFSDTDFIIKPEKEQLAQIAVNAAKFVNGLGIIPKIAVLSYSTKGSGEHPSLQLIRDSILIVREKHKEIIIDGELQLDAAINPDAAKRKGADAILHGDANVLIFPDITVGNVLLHALMQWTDCKVFGSFPVGLSKPVANGGRSMTAEQICDIITACAMLANLR